MKNARMSGTRGATIVENYKLNSQKDAYLHKRISDQDLGLDKNRISVKKMKSSSNSVKITNSALY